jgi:hypothetical protein
LILSHPTVVIIIMTYEQLSVLKADGDKHEGLFSRTYLDEAQAIRRCRETERERLLMALKVPKAGGCSLAL